jgi:hypothetical protein
LLQLRLIPGERMPPCKVKGLPHFPMLVAGMTEHWTAPPIERPHGHIGRENPGPLL